MPSHISELRRGAIEVGHILNTSIVNRHHSQLALNAENASYLFQPHSLHPHSYTPRSIIAVSNFVESAVKRQIAKSQQVCFVFEDGNTKSDHRKKVISGILSTGEGIVEFLQEQSLQSQLHLTQLFPDPNELYNHFILDLYSRAFMKYGNKKDSKLNTIKGMIESAPKEHGLSSRRNAESIPGKFPNDIVRKRTDQVIVSSVVRDLKLAGDMFVQAKNEPNTSFIVIRGTSHLGLATLIASLVSHEYRDLKSLMPNIEKKHSFQVSSDEFIEGPMLWNRKFWEKLIELNPNILRVTDLMHVGGYFSTVALTVRELLKTEPWNSYLDNTIHSASLINRGDNQEHNSHFVLSQEDFQY